MVEQAARDNVVVERIERRTYGRLGTTLAPGATPPRRAAVRRPALIAVRLAQALAWDWAVQSGAYPSHAALARHEGMTPQRLSQILELTLLAPDIQEQVLFLESVDGVEPVGERALRALLGVSSWRAQRAAWARMRGGLRTEAA